MKDPAEAVNRLISRANEDDEFRARLLAQPKEAIEQEFGVTLADDHRIEVREDTDAVTHIVLPPKSKRSEEEREAARTGVASLEFLKKTMHDPAPPIRSHEATPASAGLRSLTPKALAKEGRERVRRGLEFLESAIDENGAWHCIRFNVADPKVPRHFERPAFISAMCALALESSDEPRAKALRARTRAYLVDTMEHPGLWRYYRHLPTDLDSTSLCSLVLASPPSHPWIALGRNVAPMLANRDEQGRFTTWVHAEGEPDVVPQFRIEADPVVNANLMAYLGDRPETKQAQTWLEAMIAEDKLEGASKWYPDKVTAYYAIARALTRARPALDHLRPALLDGILALRDKQGAFGNVLLTAQAISALADVEGLDRIDAQRAAEALIGSQREDGSWPELLAFGDQALKWGVVGQFAHGSESVTSAFCIEALERLLKVL